MCGRFSQFHSWEEVRDFLDIIGQPQELRPRYNIAPGQQISVVRQQEDGRSLSRQRWGLIPSWAKDPRMGYRMINARSETAHAKPSFRSAFKSRRCVVPADGYYEWKAEENGKQPYRICHRDDQPLVFAGLWETWKVRPGTTLAGIGEPGDTVETCTILTADANQGLSNIHHRMPVILEDEDIDRWLRCDVVELGPFREGVLEFYPVTRQMNNARFEEPSCIEPLESSY